MKKLLLLMTLACFTVSNAQAVEKIQPKNPENKPAQQERIQRENLFEKRLGLTEVQKLKARQVRIKGHEELRPVIEQIIAKKQEAEMIRRSRIAVQVQEERLSAIDKDLAVLEKKAKEIRKKNMKEFESILTREQRKILKNMKKEGRKKYQQAHPVGRPPMHFTTPNGQPSIKK